MTKTTVIDKFSFYIVWAILALIGYLSLSASPVGGDEPFSIFTAQNSIADIITALRGGNNPPLFEIVLHYWIDLFGVSPVAVRFPSYIFSLVLLVLVYRICRLFSAHLSSLLVMALVGFSNYYIYFLHEARAYSLLAVLTVLSVYLVHKAISSPDRKMYFIVLSFLYALLAYTHYFGLFVVFFQIPVLLFVYFDNATFRKHYLYSILGFLVLLSPYIPEIIVRFTDSVSMGTWIKPVENLGHLHDIVFLYCNKSRVVYFLIVTVLYSAVGKYIYTVCGDAKKLRYLGFSFLVLFYLTSLSVFISMPVIWKLTALRAYTYFFVFTVLAALLYYVLRQRRQADIRYYVVIWFVLSVMTFYVVSFKVPIFLDRYLAHTMPAFYILIAAATIYLFSNWKQYLVLSILLVSMVGSFSMSTTDHSEFDNVAAYIRAQKKPDTPVFICPPYTWLTYLYHYDRDRFKQVSEVSANMKALSIYPVYNKEEVAASLIGEELIYIDVAALTSYPQNGILEFIGKKHSLISKKTFKYDLTVYTFGKTEKDTLIASQ